MDRETIYVIYHKVDLDGLFGAWACAEPHKDANIIWVPMNYWDELPCKLEDMKGHRVYIVDFSLPTEQMAWLNENADLYRFDHHISAIKDNEHLDIQGKRDIKVAGCYLAFHYHPVWNLDVSWDYAQVIKLISDYDTWNHESENDWDTEILPFQYGMRLEVWLDLDKVFTFMETGAHDLSIIKMYWNTIIKNNKQNREQWMKKSGEVEIGWLKWLALFWPAGGSSQIFESKRDNTKYDIMVYITYNITKKEYSVSLYTDKEDVDCSVIAKTFGWWGHKWASGFVCKELPFSL